MFKQICSWNLSRALEAWMCERPFKQRGFGVELCTLLKKLSLRLLSGV